MFCLDGEEDTISTRATAELHKIGPIQDNSCFFCKLEPETLHDVFLYCTHARRFGDEYKLPNIAGFKVKVDIKYQI